MSGTDPHDVPEPVLPEQVQAALNSRYGPGPPINRSVDEAILENARQHLQSVRTPSRKEVWWRGRRLVAVLGTVAAASMLLVVTLNNRWDDSRAPGAASLSQRLAEPNTETLTGTASPAALEIADSTNPTDVDGDGRTDILDAFAIARTIRDDSPYSEQWDVNRDGRVDQSDIDVAVRTAVML
ncbi:MAG: hypothetical protein KDA96_11485 [Planctomycetaceae bacterium]|nr:hypothetical protein [Planctomycetaceae bacterium]